MKVVNASSYTVYFMYIFLSFYADLCDALCRSTGLLRTCLSAIEFCHQKFISLWLHVPTAVAILSLRKNVTLLYM